MTSNVCLICAIDFSYSCSNCLWLISLLVVYIMYFLFDLTKVRLGLIWWLGLEIDDKKIKFGCWLDFSIDRSTNYNFHPKALEWSSIDWSFFILFVLSTRSISTWSPIDWLVCSVFQSKSTWSISIEDWSIEFYILAQFDLHHLYNTK